MSNKTCGVSIQSIVPMRSEPGHREEMVSQLLFGEGYQVLEQKSDWLKITSFHDQYSGWIHRLQHHALDGQDYQQWISADKHISYELAASITSADQALAITAGAFLPKFDGLNCRIGKIKFIYPGQAILPTQFTESLLEKVALRYLGSPYLWGGRTPFGIDCSGFTQMVYRFMGISLPRDAWQQAEEGQLVHFTEEARPGDLAFFANEEGRITHTGIILKDMQIIHASGKVRIDKIDHFGIYVTSAGKYSHQLRMIKRMV